MVMWGHFNDGMPVMKWQFRILIKEKKDGRYNTDKVSF